jgi:hypothetical protein
MLSILWRVYFYSHYHNIILILLSSWWHSALFTRAYVFKEPALLTLCLTKHIIIVPEKKTTNKSHIVLKCYYWKMSPFTRYLCARCSPLVFTQLHQDQVKVYVRLHKRWNFNVLIWFKIFVTHCCTYYSIIVLSGQLLRIKLEKDTGRVIIATTICYNDD